MEETKQKLLAEYLSKEPLYSEFALLVRRLLEAFLIGHGFKFQIFHRPKDKDSLDEKIDRKKREGKDYKKLDEIEDLAGVRVVFEFETDKKNFLNIFYSEFADCIIRGEQKDSAKGKGYQGTHIIFRLDKKRCDLLEYQKYKDLKCELQISTILYHAWAEVQHDIVYKPKGDPVLLKTLGLDELEKAFEKVMYEYINKATLHLDYIKKKYTEIRSAGDILNSDFVQDIINSPTNDEIYGKLEVVEKFYYKKPEETLAITEAVLSRPPLDQAIIHKFKDGDLYGKSHKDVVLKCIDLLSSIRYYKPDQVLDLLSSLAQSDKQDIKEKALEIIKRFAKFDYNVLFKSEIGYGAQRKALDYILAWPLEKKITNFEILNCIAHELLDSSVKGSTSGLNDNEQDTITFHFSCIQPTDFVKKIRRETIDLLSDLFLKVDQQKKLIIAKTLEQVVRTPDNVAYGEDLDKMISEDAEYLLNLYRAMIFDEDDKKIKNIPVAEELEKRLYWYYKNGRLDTDSAKKLRQDILNEPFYSLFRLFAGDEIVFREEEGWDEGEAKRSAAIDSKLESINESNIEDWENIFNRVAEQYGLVAEWQFRSFNFALRKLSERKPDISFILLDRAILGDKPLIKFAVNILEGLRKTNRVDLWDDLINKIIEKKSVPLIRALIYSLCLDNGQDADKIREEDFNLLREAATREERFGFLENQEDKELSISAALINALVINYKTKPVFVEPLIMQVLIREKDNRRFIINQIELGILRGGIDLSGFSEENIEVIKSILIDLDDLDWHSQALLYNLGQKNVKTVFDVFWGRIERDVKKKESRKGFGLGRERYDAIPYHFHPDLQKYLSSHPDFQIYIESWLDKITMFWSTYNWNISHFLKEMGNNLESIVRKLIQNGDENSLAKAAQLMDKFGEGNIEIGMEIIRKTKNKKTIGCVDGLIFSTGVVSGEDGLARAYEAKAELLRPYLNDEIEQVREYAEKSIKSLEASAARERRDLDREKQAKRIEFESEKAE